MKKYLMIGLFTLITMVSYSQVVTKKYNKLKQLTTFTVDINSNININKYITPQDTMYQICFYINDSYLTFDASGIEVIFKDSIRIEEDGDCSLLRTNNSGMYKYAYYSYNKELVEKMSQVNMDGFIMHIWSREMSIQNQQLIKKGAKLILNASN